MSTNKNEQLKVLRYFLGLLRNQENDHLYGAFLIYSIKELIRVIFSKEIQEWEETTRSYHKTNDVLSEKIISEIQEILRGLKLSLIEREIVHLQPIQKGIRSLESILKFEPEEFFIDGEYKSENKDIKWFDRDKLKVAYGFSAYPEQHETAIQRVKALCNIVVELGYSDLVKKYVESFSIIKEVMHVRLFNKETFVPSYFELHQEQDAYAQTEASMWEILCFFEECWDANNRNFFRKDLWYGKKRLTSKRIQKLQEKQKQGKGPLTKIEECFTLEACKRSMKMLSLNLVWEEVQAVKMKKPEEKYKNSSRHIFSRTYLDKCLSNLMNKLSTITEYEHDFIFPIQLKLTLPDVDLLLHVTWAPGLVMTYCLNSFQSEEGRLPFFKALIESLKGDRYNAQKYLREAGIRGILRELFVREFDKNGASLNNTTIPLLDKDVETVKKAREYIQQLSVHRKEKELSFGPL